MRDKITNSPQIRFSGFADAWEQHEVGEFLEESKIKGSDGSVAKKLTVKLWRKGVVLKEEIYKGSVATQYYIRKSGQFMYGKLDFLNQAFGIVPDELDGYESTLDSPAFDFKNDLSPDFFLEYVALERFYKYQGNIANGSRKAKRIHVETFFKMPISIPSYEEQQKIGLFFKQLDDIIDLHQRKLNLLSDTKKILLQKMFPKEGSNIPEIRFAGFTDAWERRKLDEMLVNLEAGVSVNSSDYDTGYYILKTSAVKMGTIDSREVKSIVKEEVARAKTTLIKNSIIISRMNTPELVGVSGLVRESVNNIFLPDRLWQGKVNMNFSPEWFIQSINTAENIKKIRDLATGTSGSMKNISKKSMLDLVLKVPEFEEQHKIGSFFKNLDNIITLQQRELNLLKGLKKSMLQQMFV